MMLVPPCHPMPSRIPDACPDCAAVATLTETEPGIYALIVAHDKSCPTYRRILARRSRGAS